MVLGVFAGILIIQSVGSTGQAVNDPAARAVHVQVPAANVFQLDRASVRLHLDAPGQAASRERSALRAEHEVALQILRFEPTARRGGIDVADRRQGHLDPKDGGRQSAPPARFPRW